MIRLKPGDCALFASDVHIGDHATETTLAFLASLETHAAQATHLFLLGDLFDAWVGDDWCDPVSAQALARIGALADSGRALFVMRGNRDFLLDVPPPSPCRCAGFASRIRATMLDDPAVIDLFGVPALLAHGDRLCTDDIDYQRFRALTRTLAWQHDFLSRPLEQRVAIAQDLRSDSTMAKSAKAEALMDVVPAAVQKALRDAQVSLLIHGHTHRPARHTLQVDEQTAVRWVLPDWDAAEGRGGLLRVTAEGFEQIGAWPRTLNPPSG